MTDLSAEDTLVGDETLPAAEQRQSVTVGPTKIGRFAVLGKLGEGGMGTVYSAYDDTLDRRVAVKVVLGEKVDDETRLRIQREARAMAQLSHPNVVQIYEAGGYEGGLFVAMEHIRGLTLSAWVDAEPRSWQEILAAYMQAGRGLAAAHTADLVHRDFKPDNAMIGDDGRVRVLDFGLVRHEGELLSALGGGTMTELAATPASSVTLTQTGKLLGTPQYMAPEQFKGQTADARSDQFAFCVALYWALYRERPFEGDSVWALMLSVTTMPPAPVPTTSDVPAWVGAALIRGLAVDPAERYPTLPDLLAALRANPRARRRKWLGIGIGGVTVAGMLGWQQSNQVDPIDPIDPCAGAATALADVWHPDVRQRVRAALLATGAPLASRVAEGVDTELDGYADRWIQARVNACTLGTGSNEEQGQSQMLLRYRCLDGRKRDLRAVTKVLESADRELVVNVDEVVGGMRSIGRCAEARYVQAQVEPPDDPEVEAAVELLRERLAEVWAFDRAGRYEEALPAAEALVSEARTLGYGPLTAEILTGLAHAHLQHEHLEQAAELFEDAYFISLGTGDAMRLTETATSLVDVRDALSSFPAALLWGRAAQAHIDHSELGDDSQARLLTYTGRVHGSLAQHDEALECYRRVLALREQDEGTTPQQIVGALSNVGLGLSGTGQLPAAQQHYERALKLNVQTLGPDHPEVAGTLVGLASVLLERGEAAAAEPLFARALAIDRSAWGGDHPNTAGSLLSLADSIIEQDEPERALKYVAEALAMFGRTRDPEHLDIAFASSTLGKLQADLGNDDEAIAAYERAVSIAQQALGSEHPTVSDMLLGQADVLAASGHKQRAVEALEQALPAWLADDQFGAKLAEARFELARLLGPSDRGLALANQAQSGFETEGPSAADEAEEVAAWISGHQGR